MEHSNQYNLRTIHRILYMSIHRTERESAELQRYLQWGHFNILCGEGSEQLLESDEKEDFVVRAT